MATRPNNEFNKLLKLKKRMAAISEDIRFLKICIKKGITPRSHKIKLNSAIPAASKQKADMERQLMKNSIKNLYGKLDYVTLEAYHSHLKLGKQMQENRRDDLYRTMAKIRRGFECEKERKRKLQEKKKRQLMSKKMDKKKTMIEPGSQLIPGIVVNKSKEEFTVEQMDLLNKGLNYAINVKQIPKEEIIMDIEAAIKFAPEAAKKEVREHAERVIKTKKNYKGRKATEETRIVKELKNKPVYYMKADKGNTMVIMDKEEYDERVKEKLRNGKFREIKTNPLPESLKRIEKTLAKCADLLGDNVGRVRMPNPCLPRIRCLPKLHKEGNEMREIIAAMNSPTQKIAKWVLGKFKGMEPKTETHAVRNSKEFVKRIQKVGKIEEDEVMVSFDVKALYPSIPVKEALVYLEEWLEQRNTGARWRYEVKQYIQLARLCMEERYFVFRGKFYKCIDGVSMGNPLSGFISEIFMEKMEDKLGKEDLIPRFWARYVDDVFAIVHRDEVEETLRSINCVHRNIRFTMEIEENGRLPFLDLEVKRREGKIELGIYRKPTSTQRFIPNESNHHDRHKTAAFRTMIHRLYSIAMKEEDFNKEAEYIKDTARKNGYSETMIKRLMVKEAKRNRRNKLTTLQRQCGEENIKQRAGITYDEKTTKKIGRKLKGMGIVTTPTSKIYQLKNLLGSTKDKKELGEKCGIYKIQCPQCNKAYIGQTKRLITKRVKEHIREAAIAKKKKRKIAEQRSAVARHIMEEGHNITLKDITAIREVTEWRKLEAYESLYISKEAPENLMNTDKGFGYSPLFEELINKGLTGKKGEETTKRKGEGTQRQ